MCPQIGMLAIRKLTVPLGLVVDHSSRHCYPPPTHYRCLNLVRSEMPTQPPFSPSNLQEDPDIKTTESWRPFVTSQKVVTPHHFVGWMPHYLNGRLGASIRSFVRRDDCLLLLQVG